MSFRGKKILVTGGAGFIGSNLAIALFDAGAELLLVDNLLSECGGNRFNLDALQGKVEWLKFDLRNYDLVDKLPTDFDIVFHLAGHVSHQNSMNDPLADLGINVTTSINILEFLRRRMPRAKLIHSGTRQIYGSPSYLPVDESHPVQPPDVNGIHKYTVESLHQLYSRVHDLQTVILRLTNTYGPRQYIQTPKQGVVGWFLNRILLDQPIHLYGGGSQLRDFSYIDDTVDALLRASQLPSLKGQAFNLSGPKASLKEVADILIEITGRGRTEIRDFPLEAKKIDIGDYYGTSKKFEEISGWSPQTSLRDGLLKTIEFFKKNKEQYLLLPN